LAEECAEVQQSVGKALRFGLDHGYPDRKTTNAQDIAYEIQDVIAIVEMLDECGAVPRSSDLHAIDQKKAKVAALMEFARQRGTLRDSPEEHF